MSKVLAQLLVVVAVVMAAAALGWEPSVAMRVTDQTGETSLFAQDDASFEDDDEEDDDDVLESGLPAPDRNEDESDADVGAAPLDALAWTTREKRACGSATAFLNVEGLRPSGGHRQTSERPPRA